MRRLPRKEQRLALIDGLSPIWRETLHRDWPVFLHPPQQPPEVGPPELGPSILQPGGDWRTWLFLGGRGAGKTRTGAEWLTGIVHGDPHYLADIAGRTHESGVSRTAVIIVGDALAANGFADSYLYSTDRTRGQRH